MIHSWDLDESEALRIQKHLASKVIKKDQLDAVQYVAGVDVAYDEKSGKLVAAAVVLDAGSLNVAETAIAEDVARFPYIPGLFIQGNPSPCQSIKNINHLTGFDCL
jgi:deoxyribonuclease V